MTVAYYNNEQRNNNNHTHHWMVSNDFALSKRTTLHQEVAFVDADSGATIKTSTTSEQRSAPPPPAKV